jgi:hypothetical protein
VLITSESIPAVCFPSLTCVICLILSNRFARLLINNFC